MRVFLPGIMLVLWLVLPSFSAMPDIVTGNLRQFTDNGTWSLYRSQRVVADQVNQKLVIGSVPCYHGINGVGRQGTVETICHDIMTSDNDVFCLTGNRADSIYCDNRYTPSLLLLSDGQYLSVYASLSDPLIFCSRLYSDEQWMDEHCFKWSEVTGETVQSTTPFSYLTDLSSETRLYNFIRSSDGSFHVMVSSDGALTWEYGGRLFHNDDNTNMDDWFIQFTDNGVDRIDLICTGPGGADRTGAVFHGYIKGGTLFNSSGAVIDTSIFDSIAVSTPQQMTALFPDSSLLNGEEVQSAWCTDLHSYEGDTIVAVITARTQSLEAIEGSDHAIIYCLCTGTTWQAAHAANIGMKPVIAAERYSDQTALSPDDRNILFLSSTIDPENGEPLGVHEIFKGTYSTLGQSWQWEPITGNSTRDNIFPIVPAWNGLHTALLWMRGNCLSAHHYDASIVGIVHLEGETLTKKRYIDSNHDNTLNACGFDSLTLEYSEIDHGGDNRWHENDRYGNAGTVIVSSENDQWEDAMLIKQMVALSEPGTYDFWSNFWGKPDSASEWLIATRLLPEVVLHRQMACRTVDVSEYEEPPMVSIGDSLFLYQAYAGRLTIDSAATMPVFIDDHVTQYRGELGSTGDRYRTWFDGISYARVETPAGIGSEMALRRKTDTFFTIHLSPSRSHLRVTCLAGKREAVVFTLHDLRGRTVLSRTEAADRRGIVNGLLPLAHIPNGTYLCRAAAGKTVATAVIQIIY